MQLKITKSTSALIFSLLFHTILFSPIQAKNYETIGNKATISGYVKDAKNGEVLIGATVSVKGLNAATMTNTYGFYSLTLTPGVFNISYSYIGYTTISKTVELTDNTKLNIELSEAVHEINEVTITADRPQDNIKKAEMSVAKLEMKTIKKIPALMGEVDVIKAIQMLPGVQSTSEGTSGFSVRGGGMDQNLIILDEATVYNASHLMGFFSVFNNDAIHDVKLYKGDMPASYGGRLSSVMDVRMKEGNNKKLSGTGGIGLISSRLTLEGPILSKKTSFLISGRRTYVDVFFPLFPDTNLRKSQMYFYDLNLKLNHQINENNRLFLSGYLGRDNFGQKGTSSIGFGNKTFTLRWNHVFSSQLFSNITAVAANYDYSLYMKQASSKAFWNSGLLDYTLKADFSYYPNAENEIKFGVSSTYHDINPCEAWMQGENDSSRINLYIPKNYELEHGVYISNQQKIGDRLTLKYGIRYSAFQNMGKTSTYKYDSNHDVIDSLSYASGKIFHTYQGLEPRLGANYTLDDFSSVKASYSRTIQYMQLASNSNGGMPLDVWFPASPNVKPPKADQFAVGYVRNFLGNILETSVEAYYKKMYDVVDFKDHASLLMNSRMEGEIRIGKAESYGLELMIKKNEGKLNGWISYTLSKSIRKVPEINDGKAYPAPYDKPNSVNVILNYEFTKRITLSANWIYATGAPVTLPVGSFEYGNTVNKIYADRNGYRMRDYHRLDLSLTIKPKKKACLPGFADICWNGEWIFSVYNAYGRHNDWIINFMQNEKKPQVMQAERWYLPFLFFPAITYNFNF